MHVAKLERVQLEKAVIMSVAIWSSRFLQADGSLNGSTPFACSAKAEPAVSAISITEAVASGQIDRRAMLQVRQGWLGCTAGFFFCASFFSLCRACRFALGLRSGRENSRRFKGSE